jgi:hypothetical protein
MSDKTTDRRSFERGAWFAFDVVLSWINTQDERLVDKHALYRAVMEMRPAALEREFAPRPNETTIKALRS